MRLHTQHKCHVSREFLQSVLQPYRPDCRYLKQVDFVDPPELTSGNGEPWESMVARGQFAIDQSCYIDDTGHFNAVEFNICYNQLAYVLLAVCVRERLMPALADFDLQSFYTHQLSNYLIHSIQSHYHAQINPRDFYGEVRVVSARKRGTLSILRTHCRFYDSSNGASDGEVKLAVLTP